MSIQTVNGSRVPDVRDVLTRFQQYQKEMLARVQSGDLVGVGIDDERLLNAAATSVWSPDEWAAQDGTRKQTKRTDVDKFWNSQGTRSKQAFLNESKPVAPTQAAAVESNAAKAAELRARMAKRGGVSLHSKTDTSSKKTSDTRTPFLTAMRPDNIRTAFGDIVTDLRRWDDLPQKTGLEKIEACFFDSDRMGAIVASCLLMITLVALVVILTM